MRSWLKNISRIVLIFLIVFVSWHYFKKSASLIKNIKDKSVVVAIECEDSDGTDCDSDSDSDDSDSDSDSEPDYKKIPDDPSDPDWPQFQADADGAEKNPSLCNQKCSYWNENGELVVKDDGGDVIRVWQPYQPFEDSGDTDSDDDSPQLCNVYCPASTAPACGGSCSGCYQWATCEEWDCDKPGCSCSCSEKGEQFVRTQQSVSQHQNIG